MIKPTTDQLRRAAELLGYNTCGSHAAEIGEDTYRLGLLVNITTMAEAHAKPLMDSVHNAEAFVDTIYHNVSAETGLIECDDPLHTITGSCCGLIP